MRSVVAFVVLQAALLALANVNQRPLSTPSFADADGDADGYQFDWPIQRVAVIGAGPSGIAAYRELTEAGFEVRLFERDSVPGGNWHYTDEARVDAPVPNAPTAISDFVPSLPPVHVDLPYTEEFEDASEAVRRDHRGPKSIWESLTSNAPSPVQQFPLWPWPAGTPWRVSHYQLRNYVRSYASYLHINSNDDNPATSYNTRVEHMEKRVNEAGQEQGWRLWLRSIEPCGQDKYRATWWTEDFDAVAVAVGKYSAPSMPSIPGLDKWVQKFPSLVRHSRQYRRPEIYTNQTVLIVGASTSGSQVSIDLNRHVKQIYQSVRPDTDRRRHNRLENFVRNIPKNTTLVGEIKQFLPISDGSPIQSGLVELRNGTVLSGIDGVIFTTGYRYSFPFLPQYYDDTTYVPGEGLGKVSSTFLPLDGSHIRDLYLDHFYIQDPTLAFLGMADTQQFSVSQYSALALAKVWSNTAKLPNIGKMMEAYEKTVKERGGYSKRLMFWGSERTSVIVRYLIGWLNESAAKYGGKQIDGVPKYTSEVSLYWRTVLYGGPLRETLSDEDEAVLASLGIAPMSTEERGSSEYDAFFDW